MALTAAEKQQRYREKRDSNTEKRAAYLAKEKKRWVAKKKTGKVKSVHDLSEREQRQKRKEWKIAKHFSREKMKAAKLNANSSAPESDNPEPSRQQKQADRQMRRKRSSCYKELAIKRDQLCRERLKVRMLQKRCLREMNKARKGQPLTPNKKTQEDLQKDKKELKKVLTFHHTLVQGIKKKYAAAKGEREKQAVSKVITGPLMKKYRLQRQAETEIGFSPKRWQKQDDSCSKFTRKKAASLSVRLSEAVQDFFERDDVSRLTSGKKQTITSKNQKEQKRFPNDSLKHLHQKFLAETDVTMS